MKRMVCAHLIEPLTDARILAILKNSIINRPDGQSQLDQMRLFTRMVEADIQAQIFNKKHTSDAHAKHKESRAEKANA